MGQAVRDRSEICPLPPGPLKDLKWHMKPRNIFMAIGLTFILATSGLVYYSMQPIVIVGGIPGLVIGPKVLIPHGAIEITGDANFSATALLEGWPGDGSPEDPFIINGLEIDLGGELGHCIEIISTRVSFIISNCNLTGAASTLNLAGPYGLGIYLANSTNGVLVNNTCNNNRNGIFLVDSNYNIVANNTCYNNTEFGILLENSHSNTVANNTCTNSTFGISLHHSTYNTVANNICYYNWIGIRLYESYSNTITANTFSGNTEHDILELFETEEFNPTILLPIGLTGVMMLGAVWRMLSGMREFN